jgi:tRNA threonylcarbamoyladenosine biosynthesis protein TsaE
MICKSHSCADTADIAKRIASILEPGDLISLNGTLGSGKTTFVKSLVESLELSPGFSVSSPTYTIANIYETSRSPILHLDFYRLADENDLADLGFFEWLESATGIVLVEWFDHIKGLNQMPRLDVSFTPGSGEEERNIQITAISGRFKERGVLDLLKPWQHAQDSAL